MKISWLGVFFVACLVLMVAGVSAKARREAGIQAELQKCRQMSGDWDGFVRLEIGPGTGL